MPHIVRSTKNTNVMRLYLVFIFSVFFCFNCGAQKLRKLRLIEAKWDESINAPVIPDDIYTSKAEALVFPRYKMFKGKDIQNSFSIYWPSPIIDGESLLIITQKQIILTTGHENPNPDYLYWFVDISRKQYEIIAKNINKSANSFKEYGVTADDRQLHYKYFVPENKRLKREDSYYKRYLNAKKLIIMFNKGMTPNNKIIFPDWKKFRSQAPILTAGNADEINDSFRKAY